MKRIAILLMMVMTTAFAVAQTLTASAPSRVSVGEQFRLSYTVNTQNVSDFRAGHIPAEFALLIDLHPSMQ